MKRNVNPQIRFGPGRRRRETGKLKSVLNAKHGSPQRMNFVTSVQLELN